MNGSGVGAMLGVCEFCYQSCDAGVCELIVLDCSDSSGSEGPSPSRKQTRPKRKVSNGSANVGNGRRRKSGISARERNLRRLESNERERMRMHSLNDAFEVRQSPYNYVQDWSGPASHKVTIFKYQLTLLVQWNTTAVDNSYTRYTFHSWFIS
jgi:hypothetical protein